MAKTQAAASIYSVHPGVAMVQSVVEKMKEKTGRPLDEWIVFVKKRGPATEEARRQWLKTDHKLGTNYAWWIAERVEGKGTDGDSDAYLAAAQRYVDDMFAGPKAALKPLYRSHVFAQIRPSTRSRIDFGLALGSTRRQRSSTQAASRKATASHTASKSSRSPTSMAT